MNPNKTLVLNASQIEQKINRIAYQIYENNHEEQEIIIAGIASNGFGLAQRIASKLQTISSIRIQLTEVVVNKENPLDAKVKVTFAASDIKNKVIVVIDDVLNSGKTLIYGLSPFLDAPVKCIRTAVLVDRNHNRYPVKADYVGLSMATTLREHIAVELDRKGEEAVYLL